MKLNRKWLLVIALVMSLTLATAGTLAYLTDRDTVENTFTLGNVDIEVEEVFPEGGAPIKPGEEVNKDAKITNEGTNPAWVWMTVSIPETLVDYVTPNWANGFEPVSDTPEIIDGQAVWTVLVEDQLPAGESTEYILDSVTLSPLVDYQGGEYVVVENGSPVPLEGVENGSFIVTVNGYATQVDEFATVDAAYEGYQGQWTEPDHVCWDGTTDTSWYNDTDTEFEITTGAQLAGLAQLVDQGNSFAGKTIKLGNDICLEKIADNGEPVSFDPIGDKEVFEGTLDGQNHTIENLYQSGWAFGYEWGSYGSIGLFGNLNNATVKNLTISGAECLVEGGDVALIAGSATGDCTFENITLEDSVAATYNNGCGSIIGWSGAGSYTFRNITVAEDVVLAGLWGSFDSSIGGIVGQGEPGADYNFENVDIACRIDAYNDVTAAYDYYNYRMCGMIIGRLAKTTNIGGTNYPDVTQYNITCDDVTVTYGDWANYHYCRASGAQGKRVEAGYSYDGIAADYDHSVCTVHHLELMPFDQIFGGDQYGVKGLPSYEGVSVVYNNH